MIRRYELLNDTLTFKYFSNLDNISALIDPKELLKPSEVEHYVVNENQLFKLNSNGRRIKRKFDRSIKTRWSWLIGHKYRIERL